MIIRKTDFIMCGFLNMDTAEKLNAAAIIVSGVKSFEDVFRDRSESYHFKGKNERHKRGNEE